MAAACSAGGLVEVVLHTHKRKADDGDVVDENVLVELLYYRGEVVIVAWVSVDEFANSELRSGTD